MEYESGLTKSYHKSLLFKDLGVYLMGFSGTDAATLSVFRDKMDSDLRNKVKQKEKFTKEGKITDLINKGQLSQIYLPVLFEYSMLKGIEEGLLSPYKTLIVNHYLDTKDTSLQITKKQNGTEQEWWNKWTWISNSPTTARGFAINIKVYKIPNFLKTLPSKIKVGRNLLKKLGKRKTIIFGATLDWLRQITDNVVDDKSIHKVKELSEGKITDIASSKRLQRGITIDGLDTMILFLTDNSSTNFLQKLGRIIRPVYGKTALLIIVVTNGTNEDRWMKNIVKVKNYKNKVLYEIPLNIYKTINSYILK